MCQTIDALTATAAARILADTNRDGQVNDADLEGKEAWTSGHGALFLANIGDTDQRCSKLIRPNITDETIDDCNDASDNILRNAEYLAPLRTNPIANLEEGARGFINITDEVAAKNVRIFVKQDDEWDYVSACSVFTVDQLSAGLELGIDARDVRRPGVWDGRATVSFTIITGESSSTDSVALRVAPVLTHHHAQLAERVFTTIDVRHAQKQFNIELRQEAEKAGISEPVHVLPYNDIWTQDFFETAYSSIPGPEGPIVLRIMIRSFQDHRPAGAQVFTELRAANVGGVQQLSPGNTVDSTGNLETIPPYTYRGRSYPAGRIIMGTWDGPLPYVFEFLQAQETQEPIELDTSWLAVGHVDEFVQFLPAPNTERGWVMMVDDPLAGLDILRKVSEGGHGDQEAFSRPKLPTDNPDWCLPPNDTLNEHLSKPNFTELNEYAAAKIQSNIDILKQKTGITDEEIFRVPATFYEPDFRECYFTEPSVKAANAVDLPQIVQAANPNNKLLHPRQLPPGPMVIAYYPGIVNGVVLSDSYYLAPKPWAPIVDGKDVFEEAITKVYAAAANYTVSFMDDWYSHHVGGGEIHCGSNVWRNADAPWW